MAQAMEKKQGICNKDIGKKKDFFSMVERCKCYISIQKNVV